LDRSPIQQHTSALIKGLIEEAYALKNLDHKSLKGRLRELFTMRVLSKFLTRQFGIGTGVIINQEGKQSKEIDIIIYDNRILPPFIEEQKIGVYPAESVLATIEVRSWITKGIIKEYSAEAAKIFKETYNPDSSLYKDLQQLLPLSNLVGFYDNGIFKKENPFEICQWMMNNAKPLFGVCLINRFSWLNVMKTEGAIHMVNKYNEETKAFVAILLDNIRTFSQRRYSYLFNPREHKDWLSIYIRDQGGIKEIFSKREEARKN